MRGEERERGGGKRRGREREGGKRRGRERGTGIRSECTGAQEGKFVINTAKIVSGTTLHLYRESLSFSAIRKGSCINFGLCTVLHVST